MGSQAIRKVPLLKVEPHFCLCGPTQGALVLTRRSSQRSCLTTALFPFHHQPSWKLFFIMEEYTCTIATQLSFKFSEATNSRLHMTMVIITIITHCLFLITEREREENYDSSAVCYLVEAYLLSFVHRCVTYAAGSRLVYLMVQSCGQRQKSVQCSTRSSPPPCFRRSNAPMLVALFDPSSHGCPFEPVWDFYLTKQKVESQVLFISTASFPLNSHHRA